MVQVLKIVQEIQVCWKIDRESGGKLTQEICDLGRCRLLILQGHRFSKSVPNGVLRGFWAAVRWQGLRAFCLICAEITCLIYQKCG